ncbi:MAG: hypothetical protein ACRDKI_07260 [Solirubrobacterales bacterium]
MERSSNRIFLILLVGVALIATAAILRHNHHAKNKNETRLTAAIVEADANGAITETDDGIMRGYTRAGKLVWKQAPQFVEDPERGKVVRLTNGFCTAACPAIYTNNVGAERNKIIAHGIGGSSAPTPLGPPLDRSDVSVRGVIGDDSLLYRRPSGNRAAYSFISPPLPGKKSRVRSQAIKLARDTAVIAMPDVNREHVMVAETGTAPGNHNIQLRWWERSGELWKQFGSPVRTQRAETCFSGDGVRAALVGRRSVVMNFGGGNERTLPLATVATACTFSPDGITLSTSPQGRPALLQLVHYDKAQKQVWTRAFTHAASFNARDGDSSIFQVTTKTGTEFLDAATGKTTHTFKDQPAAFAAGGNVFVRADTEGRPEWLSG